MTSIFEGQPPQDTIQNKGPHLGSRYAHMFSAFILGSPMIQKIWVGKKSLLPTVQGFWVVEIFLHGCECSIRVTSGGGSFFFQILPEWNNPEVNLGRTSKFSAKFGYTFHPSKGFFRVSGSLSAPKQFGAFASKALADGWSQDMDWRLWSFGGDIGSTIGESLASIFRGFPVGPGLCQLCQLMFCVVLFVGGHLGWMDLSDFGVVFCRWHELEARNMRELFFYESYFIKEKHLWQENCKTWSLKVCYGDVGVLRIIWLTSPFSPLHRWK